MGLANRITLARGVLAVALWTLLHAIQRGSAAAPTLWWVAWGVFVVAAATDSLDGYFARRRGEVSVFGRIADPLVDKILILGSALYLLAIPGVAEWFPPWTAAVMLLRELLVTGVRAQIEASGGNFQAKAWGKAKMVAQCLAVGGVLLAGAGVGFVRGRLWDMFGPPAAPGEMTLAALVCIIAAAITAASGIEYAIRAVGMLRSGPRA